MARVNVKDWLTDEGLAKIGGWAKDGLTDEQIAHNIGIKRQTLYNWRKRHDDIFNILRANKEVVDRQVENALLKRALGYEHDEVTYEYGKETKRVTKQVIPDTTAQIFWLKNRKRTEWRDKQDVEHSGEMTQNHNMTNLTEEQLRKLAEMEGD